MPRGDPGGDQQLVLLALLDQSMKALGAAVAFADGVIPDVHVLGAAVEIGVVPDHVDRRAGEPLAGGDGGTVAGGLPEPLAAERRPLEEDLAGALGQAERSEERRVGEA